MSNIFKKKKKGGLEGWRSGMKTWTDVLFQLCTQNKLYYDSDAKIG